MPAAEDLAAICKSTRLAQGKSLEQFYGPMGLGKNWAFRMENPDAICPGTGKPYSSVIHENLLALLKAMGLTFAAAKTGASCFADLERVVDCLTSVDATTKAHMKAANRGLFQHGYTTPERGERGAAQCGAKCQECKGPLRRDDGAADYDPGDTELCWKCDEALYPEADYGMGDE